MLNWSHFPVAFSPSEVILRVCALSSARQAGDSAEWLANWLCRAGKPTWEDVSTPRGTLPSVRPRPAPCFTTGAAGRTLAWQPLLLCYAVGSPRPWNMVKYRL